MYRYILNFVININLLDFVILDKTVLDDVIQVHIEVLDLVENML